MTVELSPAVGGSKVPFGRTVVGYPDYATQPFFTPRIDFKLVDNFSSPLTEIENKIREFGTCLACGEPIYGPEMRHL